ISAKSSNAFLSLVDGPSLVWQSDQRRSRKSGCSNIFAGVNLRQLKRLFHVAGERDAEQRARLVLAGGQRDGEEEAKAREEGAAEAGLAQTLVGFRVKGRSRSGIRKEGHREPKWMKAFGHLRYERQR
uniref:Arginine vasopressin-induced protein 1 n=1 Tax=Esox lucius TaxID=8010 RepID=A0A3P9AAM1_ESOLU